MVRPGEDGDKAPNDKLKTPLRVLRRNLRNRRLISDDQLQFGNQIDDELAKRVQRVAESLAPGRQIRVALCEELPDKTLKSLCERCVRDIALMLVELAGSKEAVARDQRLMQFVDYSRLADARISRDQDQFRCTAPDDAIERGEQGFDLVLSPVQPFRNHEPVRFVVLTESEVFDPAVLFPCDKAALKIVLEAGCGLIAFLRRLGEQ